MAETDSVIKKEIVYIIILMALFVISMQLQGLSLEPNVAEGYVRFYQALIPICMFGAIFLILYKFLETEEFKIIESKWLKIGIHLTWIIIIIILTTRAGQILPVPKASVQEFQLSVGTELYTATVIPGLLEDFSYNLVFPLMIVITGALVIHLTGRDVSRTQIIALILGACFISSLGYNVWVIPGFASAHVPAYGQQPTAYLGAFIFSYGQSTVNLMTGWFIPFAHIIHNGIIAWSNVQGLAIGGVPIT